MNQKMIALYSITMTISKIGNGFFFFINTWLALELTGHVSTGAISLIMTIIPSLIFSPLMGVLVDYRRAEIIAATAEILRCVILLIYAVSYKWGIVAVPLVYSVSFCVAFGSELQLLAWRAALARQTNSTQMLRLNAITVVCGQSGVVFGAATSGILFMNFGALSTLLLASLTFFIAGILTVFISRNITMRRSTLVTLSNKFNFRQHICELQAGFKHIFENPQISFFYLLILINITVLYSINSMLAPFVREELHLYSDAFGKIDASYSIGAIVGGLLVVRLANQYGYRICIMFGFIILAISLGLFSQANGLLLALVSYVGIGMSCQSSILLLTLAQKCTDTNYQGRVYATFNILNGFSGLVVYSLVAITARFHIYREIFFVEAVGIMILTIWLLFSRYADRLYIDEAKPDLVVNSIRR